MSAFDVTTVLEALRVADVVGNRMTLQYEVPQPSYQTKLGRSIRQADKTEEGIIGYSVYTDRNAQGEYKRVVAHKDDSHVLHIIAIKATVDMAVEMTALLDKSFPVTELLEHGGAEGMAGRLVMDYLGKPVSGEKSENFHRFFDANPDRLESWTSRLTITPYLSKFPAHEMCLIGKHSSIDTAIQAHPKLSSTFLF